MSCKLQTHFITPKNIMYDHFDIFSKKTAGYDISKMHIKISTNDVNTISLCHFLPHANVKFKVVGC